jgi:hypothetical protein
MSDSFFNWLKHTVRGLLVAFPLVAIYGFLVPWPAGEHALGRYPGQTPIMVSSFSHFHALWNARSHVWVTTEKDATRSYLLFPSVFSNLRIVTVSQTNDNEPTVSESSVPLIVIALAGVIALAVWGAWYIGPRLAKQAQSSPGGPTTLYGSQNQQREFGRRIS